MNKELFLKYEEIRKSGEYNMFTDGFEVMKKMKLNPRHKSDIAVYMDILDNYGKYADKWL